MKPQDTEGWDLEAGLEAGYGRAARPGSGTGSVLTSLSRFLGRAPKLLLRDDAPSAGPPLNKSSADAKSALPQGRGNYQVLGELARGGMGVVLKGHDEDLGRDVAMKVLHPEFCGRSESVQRFVEEAQIGGQLQHPGIVPVYELGLMADERPYFTMKLIKGRTLSSLLSEREDAASERRRFLTVFEQICQTMAYAHSRGVIHRDLKPSNVMVGAFGEVQVVDWGLAKVLAQGGTADERREKESFSEVTVLETVRSGDGSSHSQAGSVMGTPAYMSPEQARGEVAKIDERADVFSLGAILCQLLTGKPPYVGDGHTTMRLAAAAELDDATARLDACGAEAELVKLAQRCLAPAPSARPQNAEAVAKAIHAHLARAEERAHQAEIEAAEARVKATAERRARKLTLALAATMLVSVVTGGFGYLAYQGHEQERRSRLAGSIQTALDDATRQEGRGELAAALSAVVQAASLAEQGEVDDAVLTRLEGQRASITSALAELAAREVLEARNARLFAALERATVLELHEFRLAREALEEEDVHSGRPTAALAVGDEYDQWSAREEAYGEAFFEYGLVFDSSDSAGVVRSILASGEAERIAVYLDDWSRVRRRAGQSESAARLLRVARGVDPDPWRNRLRDAMDAEDAAAMLKLADGEEVDQIPPLSAFLLGQALYREDQYDAATALLQGAVRRHPGNFQVRYQLARSLRELEPPRYAEALRQLEASLALRPTSVLTLGEMAYVLRQAEESEEAIRVARHAVAVGPENTYARRQLAWALWSVEDIEGALVEIELAASHAPGDPYATENLAWMLNRSGDLEAALIAARDATQLHPEHARGHRTLGDILWGLGRHEDCVVSYGEAARLDQRYRQIHADALRLVGRYEESREIYYSLPERNETWHHNVGMLHQAAGDPGQAVRVLEDGLGLAPENGDLWAHLAECLVLLAREEEAAACLEKATALGGVDARFLSSICGQFQDAELALPFARLALEWAPDNATCLLNLGAVLRGATRFEEALEVLERCLEVVASREWPKDVAGGDMHALLHANLGACFYSLGRTDEALEAVETSLGYDPHLRFPKVFLAQIHHDRGDHETYEVVMRQVLEDTPDDPGVLTVLGTCLTKDMGRPEEGLEMLQRSLELAPETAETLHQLGHTYQDLEMREEAAHFYRQALQLANSQQRAHFREMLISMLPGDSPEAAALCAEALEASPDDAATLNSLAWMLVKNPASTIFDPEAGAELADRAVALAPDNPYYWNTYGTALLRVERFEEAIAACLRSVELSGDDEWADDWYVVALARHALGQFEGAQEALTKARALHTDTLAQNPDLARLAAEARTTLGE